MSIRSPAAIMHGPLGEWVLNLRFRTWPRLFRTLPPSKEAPTDIEQERTSDFTAVHAFGFPTAVFQLVSPPPCENYDAEERLVAVLQSGGVDVPVVAEGQDWPAISNREFPWEDRLSSYLAACQVAGSLSFDVAYRLTMMVSDCRIHADSIQKPLINLLERNRAYALKALDILAVFGGGEKKRGIVLKPAEALRQVFDSLAGCPGTQDVREQGVITSKEADVDVMVRRVIVTPLRVLAIDRKSVV